MIYTRAHLGINIRDIEAEVHQEIESVVEAEIEKAAVAVAVAVVQETEEAAETATERVQVEEVLHLEKDPLQEKDITNKKKYVNLIIFILPIFNLKKLGV